MIGWFALSGRPIHVLLTKSDKLTAARPPRWRRWCERSSMPRASRSPQLFPSLKKTGVGGRAGVGSWLSDAACADGIMPVD